MSTAGAEECSYPDIACSNSADLYPELYSSLTWAGEIKTDLSRTEMEDQKGKGAEMML